ncbi:hypothetical protein LTR36_010712 [Oleoguttula mirabilis]|uniref:Uncharacterized protein n=1 Tax=Oleoguttula mirabilis TaxID=1507867 RepID=A0AAV9JRH5_9PEZI|nr:hypothetical protein LTR36_010712 [Oleoguttula mirabilis]
MPPPTQAADDATKRLYIDWAHFTNADPAASAALWPPPRSQQRLTDAVKRRLSSPEASQYALLLRLDSPTTLQRAQTTSGRNNGHRPAPLLMDTPASLASAEVLPAALGQARTAKVARPVARPDYAHLTEHSISHRRKLRAMMRKISASLGEELRKAYARFLRRRHHRTMLDGYTPYEGT